MHKYSKASSKTKIEQTITYNRTLNILACIKYYRPNYDLAIYWGTKNKVIGKPVTNYILMRRTFYVVFFTSYAWGQTRITRMRGMVGSGLTPGTRPDGRTPEILVLSGARAGKLKTAQWFIIEFRAV